MANIKFVNMSEEESLAVEHVAYFAPDELDLARKFCQEHCTNNVPPFKKGTLAQLRSTTTRPSVEQLVKTVKNKQKITEQRVALIDFAATYRCNLNCAHCSAAVPIVKHCPSLLKKHEVTPKELNDTLSKFYSLCKGNIPECLEVMGGEPFLHKDLASLLEVARHHQRSGQVTVVTNGTQLARASDELLKKLKLHECGILLSVYEEGTYFHAVPLSEHPQEPIKCAECWYHAIFGDLKRRVEAYCGVPLMIGGYLCYCGAVPLALTLNELEITNLPLIEGVEGDILDLSKVKDFADVLKFVNKDSAPLQRLCSRPKVVKWHSSQKHELEEWYASTPKKGSVKNVYRVTD